MKEKTNKFLNQIGINEDYISYFEDSYVEEIIVEKTTKRFHFIIHINNILPINVYDDLLNCLKETFNNETLLTLNYDGNDYSSVSEYLNRLIEEYAKNSMRYNVFINRSIKINETTIDYPIYNKIEELNFKNISHELEIKLKKYGFSKIIINLVLELSSDNQVKEEIEKEKIVTTIPDFPLKNTKPESSSETSEKPYYRPKKATEVTNIKDLLYETENINIEVQIFGIELFEAKSGYKIFTLKVTDFTDSMYVKIFTKDEE